MKQNSTLMAQRGAQLALLSYLRNVSRATPRVGLDFLNPSNQPNKRQRLHSAIFDTQKGRGISSNITPFLNDTIYALSTAPGRAGIAIVRISGPGCADVSDSIPLPLSF